MTYEAFLEAKALRVEPVGFQPDSFTADLFPFQRDIVTLACRLGRFCIWADCGMGKTPMQLEWAHQVATRTGGRVLILAPLAVSHQTVREAEKFGIPSVAFAAHPDATDARIVVTNYQKLDRFRPEDYVGVVLDESSILKSMDGKTRGALLDAFRRTPFRLACSATPAPNDYMELGNHAEFAGVMTREEMLAMFFTHDGGETSKWRLKGHAEARFWQWVCTWAVTIRQPSDLGYDDGSFVLPPLRLHDVVVETPIERIADDNGQLQMIAQQAETLSAQRAVQRASLELRVAEAVRLANGSPDQWLIWCHLNDESAALAAAISGAVEVTGSDTDAHKEDAMLRFQRGEIRVLVSKPSICGFGMNFQICANVVFVGLSHSYESYYQAIRRCWRFGQTRAVNAYVIYDWAEGPVIQNIRRKDADAAVMAASMAEVMQRHTLEQLKQVQRQVTPYATRDVAGEAWQAYMGDCVDGIRALDADSIHYSIFSPPFASLYTYSNSDRDMGNCKTDAEFAAHFQFLVRELFRALMPGRLVSFHCMNLPSSKSRDGIIGVKDFRGDLIRAFEAEGFIFHSEVCIWKDPVTAMQRTKALGLLHKTIRENSTMSRMGLPDYVVTMRKPGECETRVQHGDDLPVAMWQKYASPVWDDINQSRTLNKLPARDENDEKHMCPLQLDVIERCIHLWTNPGELVFSPFTGIGSEGYCAVKMGRRFVGTELKPQYFELACQNISDALREQAGLFAEAA